MPDKTLIHFIWVSGSREGGRTPHAVQYHFAEPLLSHAPVRVDFITPPTPCSPLRYTSSLRGLGALGAGSSAGAETVGELAVDGLEVAHAAGAGGLPALGLLAP